MIFPLTVPAAQFMTLADHKGDPDVCAPTQTAPKFSSVIHKWSKCGLAEGTSDPPVKVRRPVPLRLLECYSLGGVTKAF